MASFIKELGSTLRQKTFDTLLNRDFISRSIGMNSSYEVIMLIVQALGHEPVSLLGKDFLYIYDHVRRNHNIGTNSINNEYNCPRFTFYKERPSIRFADVYNDPLNLLDKWMPDIIINDTSGKNELISYAESDDDLVNNREVRKAGNDIDTGNPGTSYGAVSSFEYKIDNSCDLLKKTNDNFRNGKYRTLIARFHTNSQDSKEYSETQSAISKYGMSHGRNLLKGSTDYKFGYDNPYCRVWTYFHQYNQMGRAIRPFDDDNETGKYGYKGIASFRAEKDEKFNNGQEGLGEYGVLNYRSGLVNIAPSNEDKVDIKKCMFSIENLAWRNKSTAFDTYDENGLSKEQKGPFGGRIMWFPPYDLSFSEDVRVNWNSNQFIGRGEKIYTYTDTERSGNLSFTMLIDHPSMIDYWEKRDSGANDKKSSGTDEFVIDRDEDQLLRFFAGCDVLNVKPQRYSNPKQVVVKKETDVATNSTVDEGDNGGKKTIQCVLYYPNNYSGIDDVINGPVDPILYLMNGVGAQKYIDVSDEDKIHKEIDIETTIKARPTVNGNSCGGYEVMESESSGISIVNAVLEKNYEVFQSTYAVKTGKTDLCGHYLTSSNGASAVEVSYGNDSYILAKQLYRNKEGYAIFRDGTHQIIPTSKSDLTKYYYNNWYYRVDKEYEKQVLTHDDSYLDVNSKGLNSKHGYKKLINDAETAKAFGFDKDTTTLISFVDLFIALGDETAKNLLGDYSEPSNVDRVKAIMGVGSSSKYKITSINFEGHASLQGYNKTTGEEIYNEKLAENRAETLKRWLKTHFKNDAVINGTVKSKKQESNGQNHINIGGNSELSTKLWRSASVIIEYEEIGISDASVMKDSTDDSYSISIPNKESSPQESIVMIQDNGSNGGIPNRTLNTIINTTQSDDNTMNAEETDTEPIVKRYDNEGEFFKKLSKNDAFLHHLIKDKIKYFDPAFHSISPEGFGARLTFLHQCTRQGPTVGNSDQGSLTAYNLSFGRPPICVLRIGDFYYTKIVINHISLQYDSTQWDLNPEGIGVMPMFAKVTISFQFLGGSDLAGPISRLQNAVSFNYYANTSVYDNRAELVNYTNDGSGKETNFRPFVYPNINQK